MLSTKTLYEIYIPGLPFRAMTIVHAGNLFLPFIVYLINLGWIWLRHRLSRGRAVQRRYVHGRAHYCHQMYTFRHQRQPTTPASDEKERKGEIRGQRSPEGGGADKSIHTRCPVVEHRDYIVPVPQSLTDEALAKLHLLFTLAL